MLKTPRIGLTSTRIKAVASKLFARQKTICCIQGHFAKERTIWIHIPRTGGTSISISLFGYQVGHNTYTDYQAVIPDLNTNYFVFSFVRHPETRYLSAFKFLQSGGLTAQDREFKRIWKLEEHTPDSFIDIVARYSPDLYIHFRTQTSFLQNRTGQLTLDAVYQVENLPETNSANTPNQLKPYLQTQAQARLNASPQNTSVISPTTKSIIRSVYDQDYWRFNYK